MTRLGLPKRRTAIAEGRGGIRDRVLVSKLIKIVLVSLAFLIAIGSLGIDFTALTVFGGALGIGIGFGMQKIISNLVSGLILLMDKSIKPNDVIAVGTT